MAASSTSSLQNNFMYDVFLSFRGEDTRKTFVDHLYHALEQKGIYTYKDDETLEKGKIINDQLMRSIEDSRFYIVVFSKNYASSSWCLEELAKIMECKKVKEHTAYMVFYDVEPTCEHTAYMVKDLKQSGSVGEAFSEKEESVRKWRTTLQEAAGLAGWELKSTFNGHEAKLIQEIVEEISRKLLCNDMNIDGRLVGMETRVNEVFLSLKTDIDDVRMIGIKGIGGGGKTTLARAVFDQISISFDGSSFVENVKGVCKGSSKGMRSLQKQVLLDVFKEKEIYVSGVSDGKNKLKNMLRSRKVLVVLDDVDCLDQLEALAGEPNWFKPGSRIIITTRDEHVLQTHQVNFIHDVNLLFEEEAICLFSRYAFRKDIPVQGYQELSKRFIAYAAGLPLTLKVLGSFLYGKTVDEWMDTLERLKTIPLKETLEILKLSYDSLEDDYKEIFLDIAFMMKNWKKDKAIRALESCGFHAKIGLRVLEQKSLITFRVDPYGIGWVLAMHDHIEEMGKNIVRHLHPNEPYKHSRLWIEEEIEDILDKNQGTEATRCIHLGNSRLHPATIMNGVRKMTRLRFLYVQDRREYDHDFIYKDWESYVSSQYLLDSLQYLAWNGYPFACLLKFFQENNVMKFEMPDNNTEELWDGEERKVLDKLAYIDLSDSKLRFLYLESTPKLKYLELSASTVGFVYLGRSPNLELLSLRNCYDLEELYLPVGSVKLKSINMYCHPNLYRLSLCETLNLEKLDIEDCDNLVELHVPTKLKSISLRASGLRTLDLALVQHLQEIIIKECEDLVELIMPIKSLELKSLQLNGSKLRTLDLMREPNLEKLCLNECDDLVELYMPVESLKLKTLVIYDSKVTIDISRSPNLEILELFNHGHFVELQLQAVSSLRWLRKLVLWGSFAEVPKDLQLLEFLEKLTLSSNGTKDLRSIFMLKHVKVLKLIGSCLEELPEDIGILESLEEILLSSKMIKHLPNSICTLKQLKVLCIQDCDLLEQLPENIGILEILEELILSAIMIEHLPNSICMLKHLKILKLTYCYLLEHVPEDLGRLEYLETLDLTNCIFLHGIPSSICQMKHLETLHVSNCVLVPELPKEVGRLKCLKRLYIEGSSIIHLPPSIFQLKSLRINGSMWWLMVLPTDARDAELRLTMRGPIGSHAKLQSDSKHKRVE